MPRPGPWHSAWRYLKRNSAGIAMAVLFIQIMYIFVRLNIRAINSARTANMPPDYMYNYVYHNVPPREKVRQESDRAAGAARGLVIQYDEDYDHLDYEPLQPRLEAGQHEPLQPNDENIPNEDDNNVVRQPHEVDINQEPMILAPIKGEPRVVEPVKAQPKFVKPVKEKLNIVEPAKPQPIVLAPIKQEVAHVPEPEKPKPQKVAKPLIRLCTMEERVHHLEKYCNTTDTGDKRPIGYRKSRYGGLVVDEKHKLVFCDVSQMATIAWLTVLAKATGKVNTEKPPVRNRRFMNKIGLKYLDSYTTAERDIVLKNYFKFLVVQHPFDRLVSQWKSKLVDAPSNEPWKRKLGHQILLAKRKIDNRPVTEDEISSRETVYFDELVDFAFVERNMVDPSWFTYLQVCHPCEIRYNAILRVETFKQDANVILSRLSEYDGGLPSDVSIPTESDILYGRYNLKSFQNVTQEAQTSLWKKFGHDVTMFGYTWDQKSRNATCNIHVTGEDVCC